MKGFILFVPLVIFSLDSAWKFSGSTTEQLAGEIINRVETTDNVVALTFDDGPTPGYAQRILDVLEQEDVRATFFLVGNAIEAWPAGARRIIEAGHGAMFLLEAEGRLASDDTVLCNRGCTVMARGDGGFAGDV